MVRLRPSGTFRSESIKEKRWVFWDPNGAGKSTTIRILTCFMPPSSGIAKVDGLDCVEHSLEIRAKIGYLPENVPLYKDLDGEPAFSASRQARRG